MSDDLFTLTATSVATLAAHELRPHSERGVHLGVGDVLLVGVRVNPPGTNRFTDRLFAYRLGGVDWHLGQRVQLSADILEPLGGDLGATFTTSPGLSTLQKPLRTSGTPVVQPGFYWRSHERGRHGKGNREHIAFVEFGVTPLAFNRWSPNELPDYTATETPRGTFYVGPTEREFSGLNVHAAGLQPTDLPHAVNGYSAGCQVVQNQWASTYRGALNELRRLEVRRELAFANGQKYDPAGHSNQRTFAHYLLIDRTQHDE